MVETSLESRLGVDSTLPNFCIRFELVTPTEVPIGVDSRAKNMHKISARINLLVLVFGRCLQKVCLNMRESRAHMQNSGNLVGQAT